MNKKSSGLFISPECIGSLCGRLRHEGDSVLTAERGKLDSCSNTLKPQECLLCIGMAVGVRIIWKSDSNDSSRNASVVLLDGKIHYRTYRTGSKVIKGSGLCHLLAIPALFFRLLCGLPASANLAVIMWLNYTWLEWNGLMFTSILSFQPPCNTPNTGPSMNQI